MSRSTEIDGAKLWLVLSKAHRALRTLAEQSIVGTGLGFTDFMVLEALLHRGPMTITEIQSKILLASGSMTAAIDRLEKGGLVTRNFTSTDRRARVIELTADGKRVIQARFKQHRKDLESATSPLNAEERWQLYTSLKKLGLYAEEIKEKQSQEGNHLERL